MKTWIESHEIEWRIWTLEDSAIKITRYDDSYVVTDDARGWYEFQTLIAAQLKGELLANGGEWPWKVMCEEQYPNDYTCSIAGFFLEAGKEGFDWVLDLYTSHSSHEKFATSQDARAACQESVFDWICVVTKLTTGTDAPRHTA